MKVQAVAARDKHRAVAYADKHDTTQVHESYEGSPISSNFRLVNSRTNQLLSLAMLDDPSIDAVYIRFHLACIASGP